MLKELKDIFFADHGDLVEAKREIEQLQAANDNLGSTNAGLVKGLKARKADNDNTRRRLDALERKLRVHGW